MRVHLLVTALIFSAISTATAQTSIHLVSEPGDPVGAGQEYFFDSSTGSIEGVGHSTHAGIRYHDNAEDEYWFFSFEPRSSDEWILGPYEDAGHDLSPVKPGLLVRGPRTSCRSSRGRFDLLEVEYGDYGKLVRFAAAFEQRCDGASGALFGTVLFNASGAVHPPQDLDGDGVADTLDNCRSTKNPGQRDRDSDGKGDRCDGVHTNTFVSVDNFRESGDRSSVFLTPLDAAFTGSPYFESSASVSVWGSDLRYFDFRAPNDERLTPGLYEDAGQWFDISRPWFVAMAPCDHFTRGQFSILEIRYNARGKLDRFAADFSQECDGVLPPMTGAIRFNASKRFRKPSDVDRDGVLDIGDNCARRFNPLQRDADADGVGDACDTMLEASFVMLESVDGEDFGLLPRQLLTPDDHGLRVDRVVGERDNEVVVHIKPPSGSEYRLTFGAPVSVPLEPGSYENTRDRSPWTTGVPQLDVLRFGHDRCYRDSTGRFDLHELALNRHGEVDIFSADFELYCVHDSTQITGSVRYKASHLPLPGDPDGDGILEAEDNCAGTPNSLQIDHDADGIGASCHTCPRRPARIVGGTRRGRPGQKVRVDVRDLSGDGEVWFGTARARVLHRGAMSWIVEVPDVPTGGVTIRLVEPNGCRTRGKRRFLVRAPR